MKMKKKEKKKIMKIVQKFISNINGKENRERASVVLTKIVNESKVLLFLYIIRIFINTLSQGFTSIFDINLGMLACH